MNCEDCQDLLSLFLDDELDCDRSAEVQAHLTACPPCAKLCADFAAILESVSDVPAEEVVPPNPQALWCRISNVIESEIQSEQSVEPPPERSRRWNFTFPQLGSSLAAVALVSSLLTVVGLRNYFEPSGEDFTTRSPATQTTFEKVLVKVGLAESPAAARERRIKEQEAAIEYWKIRVSSRRSQWDAKMRDAFDRNLHVIDESVNEYTQILQQNPDDELSGEMLNSVLDEKMELLRAFSEL